jgi:hypothetical protein
MLREEHRMRMFKSRDAEEDILAKEEQGNRGLEEIA